MNKNLFLGMFAAASMLLATSCSNDELEGVQSGNEVQVTFSLAAEGTLGSRAISDGSKADKLVYAVYKLDAQKNPVLQNVVGSEANGQFVKNGFKSGDNVSITLAKGQTYQVAFWAQDADCNAYNTNDLQAVEVKYTNENGENAVNNDELRDAFFKTVEFTVSGNKTIDVVLKRPFAQINVGVEKTDWDAAVASGIEIENSSVVIKNAANKINLLTGAVSGTETVVTYVSNVIPTETLEVETDNTKEGKEKYKWLSMSYILVADASTNDVDNDGTLGDAKATLNSLQYTFESKSGNPIVFAEGLNAVPVQRNWRTNILGKILTGDIQFNITIDPVYDGDINYPKGSAQELELAAKMGGTVTLTNNVELTEPLNVVADMILNMSDNITLTGSINVAKGVSLTVNGGIIVNTNDATSGVVSNGDLTLNNVKITSARHALRIESGNVVINSGTYKVAPTSKKTVYALNVGDDGTVANVTIKGGTFIGPKGTMADSGAAVGVKGGSTVTIEGGDFSGGKLNTLFGKGTLTVYGGTFDQNPATWVPDGYTVQNNDGVYAVGKSVASVADLTDALNNQSSVNFAADIDNGSNVININNNDVVMNMDEKEIIAGGQGTNNYAFNVVNGSNVVVNEAKLNGAGFAVMSESSVTVNSGNIAAKPGKSGRNMFYVTGNSTVTVNEGTYTFDRTSCYFVYVDEGSTCYIKGGHFEKPLANNASKDSFVNNASKGTVIITGGTFNVDPTKWLAKGYIATKSGKIWTVTAEE